MHIYELSYQSDFSLYEGLAMARQSPVPTSSEMGEAVCRS